jgi:hypothetical protein
MAAGGGGNSHAARRGPLRQKSRGAGNEISWIGGERADHSTSPPLSMALSYRSYGQAQGQRVTHSKGDENQAAEPFTRSDARVA